MSKLPIFERFLSVGNLTPKLFFKSKLKTKLYSVELVPWQSVDQVDLVAQDLVNVVVGAVLDDGVVPVDEGAVRGAIQ